MAKQIIKKYRVTYEVKDLEDAVSKVNSGELTISQAARESCIPRKTIDDHVKGRFGYKQGPQKAMTQEEEKALAGYMEYLAGRGFPMTRAITRQYVISIVKKSGRQTTFNLDKGPSDKWFRQFVKRFPQFSEREAEMQDRSRSRMSNEKVMKQFFDLLKETIDKLGLQPHQVFNCDETGFSGKEKPKRKVFSIKGQHSYQQSVTSTGHKTVHLCICADGRILPSFIIFENSLPHTCYKDGVPGNWLYGYSNNGYMDGDLFRLWFEKIFLPNCGSQRPVLLILDNHDSHITLDILQLARENNVELLGLPPHTTHILQPLDVHVNGGLKDKVLTTALNLGFANKHQVINKPKFPLVLSYAIDEYCSPARIKEAFRMCGIQPFNPDAIDKTQLVKSHSDTVKSANEDKPVPSTSNQEPDQPIPSTSTAPSSTQETSKESICTTCGTYLLANPLVTEGLIPEYLADILTPVPCKPKGQVSKKLVTEARIITSGEFVSQLQKKKDDAEQKRRDIERRKIEREEKKRKREEEKAEKKKRGGKRKRQNDHYLCKICREADPSDGDGNTDWICCDMCDDWMHPGCVDLEGEDWENMSFTCPSCIEE